MARKQRGADAEGRPKLGRPRVYTDPDEMAAQVDAYFEHCKGHVLMTKPQDGSEPKPVINRFGAAVIIDQHQPTPPGLAVYLGFLSRQSLYDYQKRPEFRDVMTWALTRLEASTAERLFDRDGAQGAKFSLSYNHGWIERSEPSNVKMEIVMAKDVEQWAQ